MFHCHVLNGRSRQAGRGLSHSPRAMRSVSLGPPEKFFFGEKDHFWGGQTSLGAPKGKCWGHVLLSPIAGFEAAVLSVFLGIQGVGGGKWASRNFRLCTAAVAPPVPMHLPTALPWVSLYMFYCPVLGSWFYVGLGPGVRPAWVPRSRHWTLPVRQTGCGMSCLPTLNSNPPWGIHPSRFLVLGKTLRVKT